MMTVYLMRSSCGISSVVAILVTLVPVPARTQTMGPHHTMEVGEAAEEEGDSLRDHEVHSCPTMPYQEIQLDTL